MKQHGVIPQNTPWKFKVCCFTTAIMMHACNWRDVMSCAMRSGVLYCFHVLLCDFNIAAAYIRVCGMGIHCPTHSLCSRWCCPRSPLQSAPRCSTSMRPKKRPHRQQSTSQRERKLYRRWLGCLTKNNNINSIHECRCSVNFGDRSLHYKNCITKQVSPGHLLSCRLGSCAWCNWHIIIRS